MLSVKTVVLALVASALALPIRREVPQEHSHNAVLASVRTSLAINNPAGIQDPVFGLLGNAAAAAGQGKITNTDCLQQATADQAFTNAKAKKDVAGMTNALIYRALERNTGKVGLASVACTAIKAVNPEIAAVSQHQDPASTGAAATNKAVVLALAKQIASIGGNAQDALQSGTFKPGNLNDNTGKGNTCDDANDTVGCIISQKLIVNDATAAEIDAAVAGTGKAAAAAAAAPANAAAATPAAAAAAAAATTVDSAAVIAAAQKAAAAEGAVAAANFASDLAAATGGAAKAAPAAATPAAAAAAATPAAAKGAAALAATSGNQQKFTGALGGAPPPVVPGGKGFIVDNSQFINLAGALGRSCDVQHNACSTAANSKKQAGLTSVSQCDTQNAQCHALIK